MNIWKNVAVAAVLSGFASLGMAESLTEARAMLAAAQSELAGKGLAAAADFNAGGKWRGPKAYVVLVDFKGNMLAHSQNEKIVGKNMYEVKDAAGKPFIQETIRNVKEGRESLVDLRWSNPVTKKIDDSKLVANRVAGHDAYVGVAFWE